MVPFKSTIRILVKKGGNEKEKGIESMKNSHTEKKSHWQLFILSKHYTAKYLGSNKLSEEEAGKPSNYQKEVSRLLNYLKETTKTGLEYRGNEKKIEFVDASFILDKTDR